MREGPIRCEAAEVVRGDRREIVLEVSLELVAGGVLPHLCTQGHRASFAKARSITLCRRVAVDKNRVKEHGVLSHW